jgi:hypothetical protein
VYKLEGKLYDDIFEDMNGYKGGDYDRNVNSATGLRYSRPFYSIKD